VDETNRGCRAPLQIGVNTRLEELESQSSSLRPREVDSNNSQLYDFAQA
jgi:hypothetical protein